MLKSSAIEIMHTFTKEDLAKFEDFVKSPFHNKKSNVVKLFLEVKKFHPKFDDKKLLKEDLWKKVFPKKDYNYGIMKNLIHDLTKLGESYLSHSHFISGLSFDRHLIKELYKRNSYDAFLSKLEKFERKNMISKADTSEFLYNKVFVDKIKLEYSENRIAVTKNNRVVFLNLIQYFLSDMLRFSHSLYIEESRVNIKHDYALIQIIVDYIQDRPEYLEGAEFIKIYYYAVLCSYTNCDEKTFLNLLNAFREAQGKLSHSDMFAACILLEGGYEGIYRKGERKYEKDFIKLLIEIVEKDIYMEGKESYPDPYLFSNIINVCSRNDDSETMKQFIHKNIHRLQPEKRESILNYFLSHASFIEKDFEKVIQYSAKINHNDFFALIEDNHRYKLNTKILVSQSYYELSNFEIVLTEIDTSLHFIKNNKQFASFLALPKQLFFKMLKKITLINFNYNEIKLNEIISEIVNFKNGELNDKKWFLEKIEELKTKFQHL